MNRMLGMIGSALVSITVILFAVFMLINYNFGSYFVCIFLALSFVLIISAFVQECEQDRKAAANAAMIFGGAYMVIIVLVYFAQTTSVRLDGLNQQALQIIDYSRSGLYFNYDLLGYGFMALSTFFAGLTIKSKSKVDKWLRYLLLIHGVFFITCLFMPMLGVFSSSSDSGRWTGVIALEFWCAYFLPVGILSFLHFRRSGQ